jgi:hypothetical protein
MHRCAVANVDPRLVERAVAAAAGIARAGQVLPLLEKLGVERILSKIDRIQTYIRAYVTLRIWRSIAGHG